MQQGIDRKDPLTKSSFRRWKFAITATCVGASATAANIQSASQCDAQEIVARLEAQDAVFEIIAAWNGKVLAYRDEAAEILGNWLGREPKIDGRRKLDEARMALAREVFTRCARAGNAGAMILEGAILSAQADSDVMLLKAKTSFEQAASKGVSIGHLGAAMIDYRTGDAVRAEQELTALLAHDKRFSPESIGMMLRSGSVFPKSVKNAQPWLVLAATKDNSAPAQRALFVMYSSGDGVPRSDVEAQRWLAMLKNNPEGERDWDAEEEMMRNIKRSD